MNKVTFTKRPIPIPADYRPLYRVGQILIILKICCRANTASLVKLHLFHWALKSNENASAFAELLNPTVNTPLLIWGFDPALNRALQFTVAEGLCTLSRDRYKLSARGQLLAKQFIDNQETFINEVHFLQTVGKSVTEESVQNIIKKWLFRYA